jgi:hypothetical protein
MGLSFFRGAAFCLLIAVSCASAQANDVLFFGNSFTQGETAPAVKKNGGVPKLVEAIALVRGNQVTTTAVIAGGQNWSYHLAQPKTDAALKSKNWNWVVLQDYSTRPTSAGDIAQFMKDGETFSDRIAATSPKAGIVLFETWSRPGRAFYREKPGNALSGPEEMMSQVHKSYVDLQRDLEDKNPNRPVYLAPVGTAFATVRAAYPEIIVDAPDQHHATAEGYYLAALVLYVTICHDSAKNAPAQVFNGAVTIPADEAAKLQFIADEVCAASKEKSLGEMGSHLKATGAP